MTANTVQLMQNASPAWLDFMQRHTGAISQPRQAGKATFLKRMWWCDYCRGANVSDLSCQHCNAPRPE